MVAPANPDKAVNNRIDTPSQSDQRMSITRDRQATDSAQPRPRQAMNSRVDVETARQFYRMENHRSATGSRLSTPQQASDLLGQVLQQFTAHPGQSLQAQSPPSTAVLSNLLERAPA